MAIKGPLNEIRVLDLTQAHAGPYGSQLLGDLGAEVIKIESPGRGDIIRGTPPALKGESYYVLALNRNKKSVTLDLYTKSGKEAFLNLVKVSDVVFDNYKYGVIQRLGIDFENLKKINPKIITCSITGFGTSGPFKNNAAIDDIIQGIAGSISIGGEPGRGPLRPAIPIADLSGGFFGAMGIITALYERQKTGKGMNIDVNLLESTMSLMSNHFQSYFLSGKPPQAQGQRHPAYPFGIFQTKNGYLTLGPGWPEIAHVLNRSWLVEDQRFDSIENRLQNKSELEDIMVEAFLEKDTNEWIELFKKNNIVGGPVNTLDVTENNAQVIHNKTIIHMDHPVCGPIKAVATPIHIQGLEKGSHEPPPTLGQHTKDVLNGILGYTDEKIDSIHAEAEEHARNTKKSAMIKM